jgi:hypothetical protein
MRTLHLSAHVHTQALHRTNPTFLPIDSRTCATLVQQDSETETSSFDDFRNMVFFKKTRLLLRKKRLQKKEVWKSASMHNITYTSSNSHFYARLQHSSLRTNMHIHIHAHVHKLTPKMAVCTCSYIHTHIHTDAPQT